ncbi:MAG: hypothetical protein R3343_01980 [Nitriliruptorales bacterium]|nr:hypothetical protein [Nitriliruptorales bacterium]
MTPARSRFRHLVAFAVAVGLLLTGCSSEGPDTSTTELEQQLEAQDRVQTALRQRIEELEDRMEAVLVSDADSEAEAAFADLDGRLADLEQGFESLSTRIDDTVSGQAELETDLQDARQALTGIQSSLSELSAQIQALREDLDSLEQQFDNHRQHD